MDLWYVVRTKARQESRAADNLERQGFCTYSPMLRPFGRRKRIEPLFPGYMFLLESPAHKDAGLPWQSVRSTRGVLGFVRFGPEPCKLDGELVEAIRTREKLMEQQPIGFKKGQIVSLVNEGSLSGLQGVYLCDKGEERCLILLRFLNKTTKVLVNQASLC
ncbi:MAG: hypothetical protein OXC07_09250 [Kistimonas sp.]|nr:hypothetical protein [Kistimonas sp.]